MTVDMQLSRFTQMVFGYWMSGAIFGLVESGVADALDAAAPISAKDIAGKLEADEQMVDSLCNAGMAIGVMSSDEHLYRWSKMGERFLSAHSPESLGDWVRIMSRWQVAWRDLGQAVRDSKVSRRKSGHSLAADPEYERDMARGMHQFARRTSDEVVAAFELDEGLMIDVGGGAGSYSIAACQRSPAVFAAVIDRAAILDVARETVSREGVAGRVDFLDLDYLSDPFPAPAGAVLFSNLFHSEPAENRKLLLEKAIEALRPGGRVLVHGHFVGADGGGIFAALQGLSSSVLWDIGGGITIADTRGELEAAGLRCDDPVALTQSGTVLLRGLRA